MLSSRMAPSHLEYVGRRRSNVPLGDRNGITYKKKRGSMHGSGPDRLKVRGYIGVSLFGRTTEWVRVPKDKERAYAEEGG